MTASGPTGSTARCQHRFPIGIEQDIAWAIDPGHRQRPSGGNAHAQDDGQRAYLREHFFERVRPIIEKALAENDRAQLADHRAAFRFQIARSHAAARGLGLLGEYQGWITTAPQLADPNQLAPFDAKPLLVLTEDAPIQEQVFFREIPKNARLRLFGSAQTAKIEARTGRSGSIWRRRFRRRSS